MNEQHQEVVASKGRLQFALVVSVFHGTFHSCNTYAVGVCIATKVYHFSFLLVLSPRESLSIGKNNNKVNLSSFIKIQQDGDLERRFNETIFKKENDFDHKNEYRLIELSRISTVAKINGKQKSQ